MMSEVKGIHIMLDPKMAMDIARLQQKEKIALGQKLALERIALQKRPQRRSWPLTRLLLLLNRTLASVKPDYERTSERTGTLHKLKGQGS